ncbi:MAG: NAD(P)/FAD-dependent oxidoreductase [Planctomycetota bacterium]
MRRTNYDVVIIGGGHNGLVAACYLAKAGKSVLVLERNPEVGGATQSKRIFDGIDARLSVYSYLISLFPQKIIDDLGLDLKLRARNTASWTPVLRDGKFCELLVRNGDPVANRQAFGELTGNDHDYNGYLELQRLQQQVASVIWPSLMSPMVARKEMRSRLSGAACEAWQALIEEPLGNLIERLIADDLIRGLVFTDGKIGVPTHPHDPCLLQNRSFLYHVIGRGTGEWRVPVGGMGALVSELLRVAQTTDRVRMECRARVTRVHADPRTCELTYELGEEQIGVDTKVVLCNASAQELASLTGTAGSQIESIEGAGFKMNMVLERLPKLRSKGCDAHLAFAGTVHIDEGYEQMMTSYRESMAGQVPTKPPGEIYCHTLTDNTILSEDLRQRGFHTITLFGLDLPYRVFANDNNRVRSKVVDRFLAGINQFLEEPIEDCLAKDCHGKPCLEAMSAVDLENNIHLPKGNIFHGDLTWPFVETQEEAGGWGVETTHANVLFCGSAARRGGAVSGIPGHNAAQKALELLSGSSLQEGG